MERIKLPALVAVSALAVVLGFVAISPALALALVRHGGFWIVTAMVAMTSWFAWRVWREARLAGRAGLPDWRALLFLAAGFLLMVVHYPPAVRVVMDEVLLLGTSQFLHVDREAYTPVRAYSLNGPFLLLGGYLDKRPILFPTLLAYVHDLTGYRPSNLFLLNGVLGFGLLGLVYVWGARLGGWRVAALGVLSLASLPLLAQIFTGGGFEVLNLVVIGLALLTGAMALREPTPARLTLFVFVGLLLSQVRYETVLFVVPVGLTVAWLWWRERRIILTWPMVLAPLFVLPYVWQNKVFEVNGEFWQPKDKANPEVPFSLEHFVNNVGHAVNFLFSWDDVQGGSLLITVPGILALAFVLVFYLTRLRRFRTLTPEQQVFGIFVPFFLANVGVILAHSWGQFDQYITHRLSLPFLFFLVLCTMLIAVEVLRPAAWRWVLGGCAVFLAVYTIPTNAKGIPIGNYTPAREVMWAWEFAKRQPDRHFLVIGGSPTTWITQNVSAISTGRAKEKRDSLQFHFRNRTHREMFVAQQILIDPDTGTERIVEGQELDQGFVLEKVEEVSFVPLRIFRLSRVVEIRDLPKEGESEGEAPATVPATALNPLDPARQEFLEDWARKLP